jgi:DNA-binding MarR family transcriptional regulator
MSEQGLFVRTADPMDGRRVYIELSERVANSMTAYLAAVRQTGLMS